MASTDPKPADPKPRTASTAARTNGAAKTSRRSRSPASGASESTTRRTSTGTARTKAGAATGTRTRAAHGDGESSRRGDTHGNGESGTRGTVDVVGNYAERAVLIPVGAALIARDRIVSSVNEVITNYSTPSRARVQLRKFERRGTTARNRLEREVRNTRTRLEREVRHGRREVERKVAMLDKRRSDATQEFSAQVDKVVQDRVHEGSELASRLQERIRTL